MEEFTKEMQDAEENIVRLSKMLKEDVPNRQSPSQTSKEEWAFMESIISTPPSQREQQKRKGCRR